MRLFQLFSISNTSQTVALASALSFGTQVVFALLMLRWFTPQEVGEFSVISQIAFFWMTLALAQAPLSLLVNQARNAHFEARSLWRSSVLRWCLLAPLALLALWLSQLSMLPALWWVVLIALCQLSWGLAQSFVLRTGPPRYQLFVRVMPPMCSVLVAWVGSQLTEPTQWQGPTLLLAALFGYFVGSLWLVPAWLKSGGEVTNEVGQANFSCNTNQSLSNPSPAAPHQVDNRSSYLRLAHTFFDVLLATAVIIVWQRLYGAQETGWFSALLRVFGFVPAVVHLAWAQVKLTQPHSDSQHAMWIGLLGCLSLVAMSLAGLFALHMQWLDAQWQGVAQYMWPLVLWQGSACFSAAFSHHPFQKGVAKKYSLACIGIAGLQLVLLFFPVIFTIEVSAQSHLICFAVLSNISLLGLAKWMHSLH
jgi:O-antigen/teichoic acid export membrane protein